VYSQLLIIEARVESQKEQQISINVAFHGGCGGGHGPMCGHGEGGCGGGRGGSRNGDRGNKIPCQVRGKIGHSVLCCYKMFDASYNGEEKHENVATTGYNVDTEWYTGTGVTDHVTLELNKLSIREKYHGSDVVHTASGSGMPISHVGLTTIHTHNHELVLKDILHVPSSSKNLLSVHKFTYDNIVFFEFHPWYFLLKDQDTKNLLLQGRCGNGLYPLPLATWVSNQSPNKESWPLSSLLWCDGITIWVMCLLPLFRMWSIRIVSPFRKKP
jgi:hypothetical protein